MATNFYPEQYQRTGVYPINHNYLPQQFADYEVMLAKVAEVVRQGDFTLGAAVDRFEQDFAQRNGGRFAIGVGSGTDALFLSLKALGVGAGDEVITTPFTFFATVGAIVTAGARPVFVDIGADHNINASLIEAAITERTKVIMPVHWAGIPCDMEAIMAIAQRHNLKVVADACHAIQARYQGELIGKWADVSCFSMHPLKNLNVWGDGGVILTDDESLNRQLSLLRNHGLRDRDHCEVWAYNSRLDTIQAAVAQYLLDERIDHITAQRVAHAAWLDQALASLPQVTLPSRDPSKVGVFHLYMARFERRDELQRFLQGKGIDAKVHYPIPMHLQPAAAPWGYQPGDFPEAEALANSCLSLPVHEFINDEQLAYTFACIQEFYS
ncbi:DegT/DnrJ/EryC1/StrS family aminotransferase [Balneatrix alpica]|uniref:DegT/DnrJ/EryC1/StrS family aminotransferase n=1 Tax=Balneatrix alpica TaxID=75684 RepID=A0ABV5ZEF6_9GAMM|nr:DegT/DnrJ/EryC1/StrS family aminotransferase [Balneatrix alpica]